MPKTQNIEMKQGQAYWAEVANTARKVEAWPDWKTGRFEDRSAIQSNEKSRSLAFVDKPSEAK